MFDFFWLHQTALNRLSASSPPPLPAFSTFSPCPTPHHQTTKLSTQHQILIVWPEQPGRQTGSRTISLSDQWWRPLLFLVRRRGESMVRWAGQGVVLLFVCTLQLYGCTTNCTPPCCTSLYLPLSIPRHPHRATPPPQPGVTSLCKYEICQNNVTNIHHVRSIIETIWHISSLILKNRNQRPTNNG